jgi:hypothetical protein
MRLTAHADYGDCAYRRVISSGVVTTTYGYDASGQRVIHTGTTTTTLYPFKFYSVASSTGTGVTYAVDSRTGNCQSWMDYQYPADLGLLSVWSDEDQLRLGCECQEVHRAVC